MAPHMSISAGPTLDIAAIPNNTHPKWWRDRGLRRLAPALAMGKLLGSATWWRSDQTVLCSRLLRYGEPRQG
jgi:hypothetical protein